MQPTRPRGNSSGAVPVGVSIQSRARTGSRLREMGGLGGAEGRWDEKAERIHLESSAAVPRAVTDSLVPVGEQFAGATRPWPVPIGVRHQLCTAYILVEGGTA